MASLHSEGDASLAGANPGIKLANNMLSMDLPQMPVSREHLAVMYITNHNEIFIFLFKKEKGTAKNKTIKQERKLFCSSRPQTEFLK